MRVSGTGAIVGTALLAYAAVMFVVSEPSEVLRQALVQAMFAAPGLIIVARVLPAGGRWLAVVTFGPPVGIGASSLALLGFWAAGARGAWLFVAAPVTALALAWPAGALRGRWRTVVPRPGDVRMLALALLLVPLLVGRPFAMVGAATAHGTTYRQYFTADYVWRRAVVAELAKGDFLPVNPYYLHDTLHYYWLPHLLSGLEHRVWPDIDLDELLLLRSVFVDAIFVAALYGLARYVVEAPWAALAGVTCGFVATSFEALGALHVLRRDGLPFGTVRYLNIDAISRWFFDGMPIDGLQRIFFYQPHHAVGYVLGLLGVIAVARRTRERDPAALAVAGSLLAASTLISSFAGLMYTTIAAAYEGTATLRHRRWWTGVVNAAWAALPLAIGAALVTAMQYVDTPGDGEPGIVVFGLNRVAARNLVTVTAMSVGPALILGAAGMVAAWRRGLRDALPFLAVLPVAAGFYFYVDIRDHQDVYVGWRAGHLVFMALIPLMGLGWHAAAGLRGGTRAVGLGALGLTVLLAAPTVAIDVFNTQDVAPPDIGRAWRRTDTITPAEADGLAWLRAHTDPRAVVQVDTLARDQMWAYIPAFAERRMAVGVPLSMVPLRKYEEGAARMRWVYDVPDPDVAVTLAARYGIDYLVVGDPERAAHPGVEARWQRASGHLPLVFHNDALSVYEVLRPDHVH
jgi:hypothetical protein